MEFVKFLGSSLGPLFASALPYLKPHLYQLLPYEIRVGELAKDVNELRKERNRVQHKVNEEENGNQRAIDVDVTEWLQEVDGITFEYDHFCEDKDLPYARFSNGYLPKPGIRFRLSRIVNDIAKRVNAQLQSTKNDEFSYWLGPPSFGADFDSIKYESFASRKQTVHDIVEALKDSNVGMIGVYGRSGVGKTCLIKQVAKEVKGDMFDVVITVNVTSHPDIRRIQEQIADKLGMILEEKSESGRAAHLRERLKDPKEKTLIILDNMGVKLDFNMLGIPSENNDISQINHHYAMKNPLAHHSYAMKTEEFDASSLMKIEEPLARYKGCKVLMISDSEQLLLSQMDGKGIQTFCVKALTEKEAETMFKTVAEIDNENSLFKTLAAQIANKCKGLPMTIVTTAKALKNKSLPVWEDAYRKIQWQNFTAMQEFSTKLSFDHLENEELKHTFLICARMGQDALITDLVRYCIGLGILQGIYTVKESRDRVHALVGKLNGLSLLSDSFSRDRFTMQDIIRDAALSIASQQMHAFALTQGKLDEWPDMDKLERYTAISLHHCDMTDIMKEFPESIKCSRLRVFHLDNKDSRLEIPDNFFNGMKELRVLKLIGIHLSSLPSSIKCLKKLRMLCLEQCKLRENLSLIGELEKLRILSLSGSDIDKLPVELRELSKLQIFDISNCFTLREIPANVISSLTSLEELYVGNSPIQWKDEGGLGNQSGENASLSELRQLNQLTTLDIQIAKITHLPKNLFFDKLDNYRIVVRGFNAYPVWEFKMLEMCEASRNLALQLEEGVNIHHQKEIKILFGRVENLLLGQLNDVEDIFYELNYEGFPYLKYLSIVSNSKVQSIINSKNQKHPEKAFPKLESLFLYEVNNMEHVCHSKLTNDSFCKLKIIRLKICAQLKNVFFASMIKQLSALETIEVSECNSLKEIVTLDVAESIGDIINFPELRSLTLHSLSEFIGFHTSGASTGEQVPNELFDEKVAISKLERMELSSIKIQKIWSDQSLTSFQNLIHMDVNDCWNLQHLLSFSMSKSLMNLQSLFVSECGMMENIFIQTEDSMIEIEPESIFPKLKNINLGSMKRLKAIWHPDFPLHSGKLDALTIEGCNKLENVFPSYMVGRFRSLCNLKVTNCMSMKEIFDLKGCEKRDAGDMTSLQNVHVEALPKLEHVWNKDPEGILNFKNLEKIWVRECLNLKHIFPFSIAMGLKKLEYLEVWNCGQLKEIVFRGETVSSVLFDFPKLTTARFSKLPNLESFYGGTHELCCSTLNSFSVEHCHKLKLFRRENANSERKPVFLPEKEIYSLKSMQIEPRDANSLKRYMGNYRMNKLEEFQLSRLVNTEILYFFLNRNPNLKSLLLSNCFFEKLVPPISLLEEKSGVVPKLKSLKLINLPSLEMIGFEEDTVLFQRLECLILKECPCLNVIAPSSVSFTYLTNLEVSNCNKLRYLMTSSTAKSLVQLTAMKVIQCESMTTIVSKQENIERINIIFSQLKEIELDALHELISFCSSEYCAVEFPCLEKVVVSACGEMRLFTSSEQVNKTPNLRQICVKHGKEEKKLYWEGDLNATIKQLYKIRALDPADMVAFNPYGALESFRLKTLKLVNQKLGPHAIPTAVFPSLKNLEELEVRSTDVEVIFGVQETEMKGYPFSLNKLTLDELPNLIQVWDKHGEGIRSFQNLQEVIVTNCMKLKTLFPSELAKRVEKLQKLEIRKCDEFLEIVEEENAITEEFSFPRLTSLDLRMLPRLTCLYPGKVIFILESLKLDWKTTTMLFGGNFLENMHHDELVELELDFGYDDNEVSNFAVKLVEKASNLEYLKISRCSGLVELFPSQPEHSAVSFSNLKHLSIKRCHKLKHLFTSSTARKLVHLEEMYVVQCESMEEILAQERDESTSEAMKFARLNTIVLDSLSTLSCFYSGSDTLQLSSLRSVLILKCPKMRIFSRGDIHAESFSGIQILLDPKYNLLFHQDLNTTVKMIQQWEFLKAVDKKCFSDHFERQAIFRDKVGRRNIWLGNLGTLKLDKCTVSYAIPSGILPLLKNLKELQVQDSDKVEVIFDTNDTEIIESASQLKKLTLQRLSKLLCVWEKNRQGLLIFPNLQEVTVGDCKNLQTLFPASLARNLKELQKLEIRSCHKLQAIVEKEEGTTANIIEKFVFPRLEHLDLYKLPQVTYFYPQTFTLECPALNKLTVLDCHELELFQSAHSMGEGEGTSTSINRQPLISNLKVISKLKELTLDWIHISELSLRFRSGQFMEGLKYLNEISLYLGADENEKTMLPIEILQKAPNLIEMSINNCNSPEIFLAQNPKIGENRMLGRLKICEKLQELNVVSCPDLTTLVHPASTVSFSCLKKVSISNCPDLQYLFTSSAAKMLMNLEEITVRECASVKEIVSNEGDATSEGIKFERLNTIVLHSLKRLICFYSGSDTLQLLSLIKVHVMECPNIKTFSQGLIYAESFQGIQTSSDPKQDLFFHQDLNATIKWMFLRKEFLKAVDEQCYLYDVELPEDWQCHGKVDVQNKWFCNLVTLKLCSCTLPHAIPSGIFPHLNNLEELEVQDSDKVEVIFYKNDIEIMETTCRLKKLTLNRLSKLAHVWEKNSQGVLIFQNLHEVTVSDCQNMQTLFPASLAKYLKGLKKLQIDSCYKLQEVVEEEEGTAANVTEKFVFPCLEKLELVNLPQVTYFYPQTFTLECPALQRLSVLNCDKLELFQSAHSMGEGDSKGTSINRQPLISNLKAISNVKELGLDWKHILALSLRFESEQFMEGFKDLKQTALFFDADENENPMLPIEMLQKAPNLTHLSIAYCKSLEIFLAENPKIGEDGMLGQLIALTLWNVSTLQSITSEDSSWLNTICEKLHELKVHECPDLTTLVHSTCTVSFDCLKKVYISNCPRLQYLFTSSSAKMLMNLEEITIVQCESVKEIVAEEGDKVEHRGEGEDKYENEMIFRKLEILTLRSLPEFESFYTGSSTLNFPTLKEVWFTQCYSTKLFCLCDKVPTKLKVTIDGVRWEGDINSVIMQQFEEEAA